MKVQEITHNDKIVGYYFDCPGCDHAHIFYTGNTTGPNWKFNGDVNNPTFTPSLMNDKDRPERRCHLIMTDGKINYCNDCYHDLSGKTIEMGNIE